MSAEEDDSGLEEIYDIMFAHRYTDEDEEYTLTVSQPIADPPCVDNYYNKPKRNFDNRGGGRGRGRGDFRGRGGWHGNQRDSYHRNRYQGDESRRDSRDWHGPDRHDRRGGHHYHPYGQGRRY